MKAKKSWTNSMGFVIGVAVILLIIGLIIPMRTSLGQGIDERTLVAWYGVYTVDTGTFHFRVTFADGTYKDTAMKPIDKKLFTKKADSNTMITDKNLVSVIKAGYAANHHAVQTDLGTYNNAPGVFHPFSDEPVAYDPSLVKTMAALHFNPKSVGGPDIVPGSVPLGKIGGNLQIDTKANGNTIRQCQPGEVPLQLAAAQQSS